MEIINEIKFEGESNQHVLDTLSGTGCPDEDGDKNRDAETFLSRTYLLLSPAEFFI